MPPRFFALTLGALALLFFSFVWLCYDPLHTRLHGDPAIYAYMAQQAAQGHPPHLAVYEVKSSFGVLPGALLLYMSSFFSLAEIYVVRFYMFGVTALSIVALYLLGKNFSHLRVVGFVAALLLTSFAGLLRTITNGIEPKAVMLLFGLLALLALQKRQWFWAGAAGACAGLAWQIGFGYVALALLLAYFQNDSWRTRLRAVGMVLCGALLPILAYALYFVMQGATRAAFEQNVVVPFFSKAAQLRLNRFVLRRMLEAFARNYSSQFIIGAFAIGGWLLAWRYALRSRRAFLFIFLKSPRTSGALLAGTGLFLYALIDFQAYPDWIPLLPFMALLASWAFVWLFLQIARRARVAQKYRAPGLAIATLVLLCIANWTLLLEPPQTKITWQDQQRVAAEMNARLTAQDAAWLVGKSELLFFMRRQNLTRYTTFLRNTDAVLEQIEPGGYGGFTERVRAAQPALIALARLKRRQWADGRRYDRLLAWMNEAYVPLRACKQAGDGKFFVRADLVSRYASASNKNCFTLARP